MLDFGIEIEFIANGQTQETVATAVEAAGVPCYAAGYSHAFEATRWKVVSDGSITGGAGFELVSPPYPCADEAGTAAAFAAVEKVCAALVPLNATVNRSCGLHVHIGARNHSIAALKKLAALYIEHEPVIDELLPASRRGSSNNFCKTLSTADITRLKAATDVGAIANAVHRSDRYVKLNFTSFWRHGTVEFRHHSGTVDAAKITKWIVLCSKMVETAVREADLPITLEPTTPVAAPRPAGAGLAHDRRWERGRQLRILRRMIQRPEGVTTEEMRVELGTVGRPNIRNHLTRLGVPFRVNGRRGGFEVFALATSTPAPAPVATPAPTTPRTVPTLEGLYARLELPEQDRSFWNARREFLAARGGERIHNP